MNSPVTTGKNMNYFLMDGIPDGRIECKLGGWSGVAYKIPRNMLVACKDIPYLKQGGVYILFCKGEDEGDKPLAYIGKALKGNNSDGVLRRLGEHHKSPVEGMEGWNEAIAFVASDEEWMSSTEASWLENRLYNFAKTASRYELKNGNEPNKPLVGAGQECVLMEFSGIAKMITGVLRHPIFESLSAKRKPVPVDTGQTTPVTPDQAVDVDQAAQVMAVTADFELKQGEAAAFGQRTSDGFVIFKDSKIRMATAGACPKNAI